MNVSGGRGLRAAINITPLVDVVLVLLILAMVMTPVELRQLEVAVPERLADVATPAPAARPVLRIAADGRATLDGIAVPREALADAVRRAFAGRRDKLLFFDIDDHANYGEVVELMDTCRGAGVTTLGLITR